MARRKFDFSIFDVYMEPIIAVDSNGKIVYQNDAFYDLCGKVLVDASFEKVFISPLVQCDEKGIGSLTYGENTYTAVKNIAGDHSIITVLSNEEPKPLVSACDAGIFTTVGGNMNNALIQLNASTSIIKSKLSGDKNLNNYVTSIEHSGMILTRIVRNLTLLYTREIPGEIRNVVSMDVRDIFENIVSEADEVAKLKGITMEFQCEDEAVHFFGNKSMLMRLLLNLISNGIKFNKQGGNLTIKLKSILGGIELKVIDSGIGIPANALRNIFSFNKRDMAKKNGLQLGLHISRRIAELHKGGLYISSKERYGTEVTAVLMSVKKGLTVQSPMESYDTQRNEVIIELSDLLSYEEYLKIKQK